jgi:TonB family protein
VASGIHYPKKAKDNKIQGKVHIKALVDLDGSVEKTRVIDGPDIFYEESLKAAVKLKFTPAKVFGKTVKCWVTVPFNFVLN